MLKPFADFFMTVLLSLKHLTPKYYQNKILAIKNFEKSLRTSVFGDIANEFWKNALNGSSLWMITQPFCFLPYYSMTQVNSKFLLMKSSEKYLIMWLMISPMNFEKITIFKIRQLQFSSEVAKFTSVWNKLNLSLKYWFIKQDWSFIYVMVPNGEQNVI